MSLFDQINEKKAVFFEDYISFNDNFPYAAQILDEKGAELDLKVFSMKEGALLFVQIIKESN